MVPPRARLSAFALAFVCSAACTNGGETADTNEELRERERPEESAPEVDLDLVPAQELSVLAAELEESADAELTLCSDYRAPASRALKDLANRARATREQLTPKAAAGVVAEFSQGAGQAADALAEIEPEPSAAARRHLELTAALRDLSDGFSNLAKALREGDEEAAREPLSRTKNGLANVEIAAEAVMSTCR